MYETESEIVVKLPKPIAERINRRLGDKSSFGTIDEYVAYVLEQVLDEIERNIVVVDKNESVLTAKDQEEVKQRLRVLGYL